MLKSIRLIIALLLSFTLAVSSPLYNLSIAYAAEQLQEAGIEPESVSELAEEESESLDASLFESAQEEQAAINIVGEIEGRRDEFSKHFYMDDGSVVAATYEKPVHYLMDGEYYEIDNALQPIMLTDDNAQIVGYRNAANSFRVQFSSQMGAKSLMDLTDGRYRIRWNMIHTDLTEKNTVNKQDDVEERVEITPTPEPTPEITIDPSPEPTEEITLPPLPEEEAIDEKISTEPLISTVMETPIQDDGTQGEGAFDTPSELESPAPVQTSPSIADEGDIEDLQDSADGADQAPALPQENETLLTLEQIQKIPMIQGELLHEEPASLFAEEAEIAKFSLDNLKARDSLYYRNVMDHVDIQYLPQSDGLKENILIHDRAEEYQYSFVIQLRNLKASLSSNNEILLFDPADESQILYYLPAPYMFDDLDEQSSAVTYRLTERVIITDAEKNELPQQGDEMQAEGAVDEATQSSDESNHNIDDELLEEQFDTTESAEDRTPELEEESELLPSAEEVEAPPQEEEKWFNLEAAQEQLVDYYFEQMQEEAAAEEADTYEYVLTLIADEQWINAEDRVFPVTIDPVVKKITTSPNVATIGEYACVHESDAHTTDYMHIGCVGNAQRRSYLKLTLPRLLEEDYISECKLKLTYSSSTSSTTYAVALDVTDEWDAATVTWANQPIPGDDIAERVIDYYAMGSGGTAEFDITKLAKRWYEEEESNHGLCLTTLGRTPSRSVTLKAYSSSTLPYLTITYRSHAGLEDYWTTHDQSVGRAGTGSVDDHNGYLTFVTDDVSTVGDRMTAAVQHVYNSNQADHEHDGNTMLGLGWTLNYLQTLQVPIGELDIEEYPYMYKDADGTNHVFKASSSETFWEDGVQKTITNKTAAKDEDGLDLYALPVQDNILKTIYNTKIQNKTGSYNLYFDGIGRLARIADSNAPASGSTSTREENIITLDYTDVPGVEYDLDYFLDCLSALSEAKDTADIAAMQALIQPVQEQIKEWKYNDVFARANLTNAKLLLQLEKQIHALMTSPSSSFSSRQSAVQTAWNTLHSLYLNAAAVAPHIRQRLTKIVDAAGVEIDITYDTNGRISTITDPTVENGVITYAYDEAGHLVSVTYADGEISTYSYSSDGKLQTVTDPQNYSVTYGYTNQMVTSIAESANGVPGQSVLVSYHDNGSTAFRYSGLDDIISTDDDIVNIYTFDKTGKTETVCSRMAESSDILGVSAYTYTDGSAAEGNKNNLKESAQGGGYVGNLLKNHGMEFTDASSWSAYAGEGSTANYSFAYNSTAYHYMGSKAAYFNSTSTAHHGEVGLQQTVSLPAGTYTLSGYVRTISLLGDAYLTAKTGDAVYMSEKVTGTTDVDMNDGWVRVKTTFTMHEAGSVDVILATDATTGKAAFDCIQLERGPTANRYNILADGSFENQSIGTITASPYWTYTDGSSTKTGAVSDDDAVYGGACYKISGSHEFNKYLTMMTNLDTANSAYMLTGWYKVTGGTPAAATGSKRFYIDVTGSYGSSNYSSKLQLRPESENWTYFSMAIPQQRWGNMKINLYFYKNMGTLFLDGLQLTKNDVQLRTYSSTGKMLSSTVQEETTTYTQDNRDRRATMKTAGGVTTTYTYDSPTNRLTKAATSLGVATIYGYDAYGNAVDQAVATTSSSTSNPAIYSAIRYDNGSDGRGRFKKHEDDARGNTTLYSYDTLTGNLDLVMDPRGTMTNYSYNSLDQITSVSSSGVTTGYAYDANHLLSGITHNGFTYGFQYDAFGNNTNIAVAGNTLVSNAYASGNGKLLSTTYANGYTVEPIYNAKEQVIAQKWNGVAVNEYRYDSDGNLAEYLDKVNDLNYAYEYSFTNRLIRTATLDGVTGEKLLELQNTYDAAGRVSGLAYTLSGGKYKQTNAWEQDDRLKNTLLPAGDAVYNTYDSLRRLTKTEYRPKGASSTAKYLITTLTYLAGAKNPNLSISNYATTPLVATYENKIGTAVQSSFTYTYDSVGNITSITDSSGNVTSYVYDALSQLKRENNPVTGKTTFFSYDDGGNLVSVREYLYTTGSVTSASQPLATKVYTYASGWKDQLTSYGGKSIEYDALGNPTKYLDKELSWSYGRQLTGVCGYARDENGAVITDEEGNLAFSETPSITYTYTNDGNRLTKTVDGVTTRYTLNGSQILREKTGDETLNYYYDGEGKLTSIGYVNGTSAEALYTVARNAQGDIVALYTSVNAAAPTLVGTYSYDAWGKITAVMPASETSDPNGMLQKNPFRYRGYYYDEETEFYYVSSRYYDPEIGRWINADNAISSTGESVQGYNLFSYCFNNPVNMDDQSGHWPKWLENAVKTVASVVTQVNAVLSSPTTVVKIAAASTVALNSGQATVGEVMNDVKNYRFFNTDETKVLNSKVFSSYKGSPVLKHDISGVTSFSVSNTIILNKRETVSNGGVDTVKHEWGHTVQQSLIGTQKYMTRIAAPSVISCIVNPSSKTYYSLPWERTADFFGGVSRTTGYHAGSDVVAGLYLIMP